MNPSMHRHLRLLLILSVAGNLILAIRLLAPGAGASSQDAAATSAAAAAQDNLPADESSGAPSRPLPEATKPHVPWWTELSAGTPRDLRLRLEAAGFPRDIIFAVVMHQVMADAGFSTESTLKRHAETPYWRLPVPSQRPARKETAELAAKQMQAVLDAFGPLGWYYGGAGFDDFRARFGDLPVTKLEQVARIQNDYQAMRMSMTSDEPADLAAVTKRLRLLDEQERADLASVLTPEELHEHDLRSGPANFHLTSRLEQLDLNEAEYRALYPVFQHAMDRQGALDDPDAARAAQAAMDKDMGAQIRAALGDARYADYLQAIDPESKRLNQLVARFELPLSKAAQVAAARREAIARSEALRNDPALTPERRAAELAKLRAETETRIATALGEPVARAYLSYDGRWLQQLTP